MIRKVAVAVFLLLVMFVGITMLALESGDVVEVITTDNEDKRRITRIWYAGEDGQLYLEAGHPDNPWVLDLEGTSQLELKGDGLDGRYSFRIHTDDHDRIRELMRSKYGWRDWWISLIFDTSQSKLVELQLES